MQRVRVANAFFSSCLRGLGTLDRVLLTLDNADIEIGMRRWNRSRSTLRSERTRVVPFRQRDFYLPTREACRRRAARYAAQPCTQGERQQVRAR